MTKILIGFLFGMILASVLPFSGSGIAQDVFDRFVDRIASDSTRAMDQQLYLESQSAKSRENYRNFNGPLAEPGFGSTYNRRNPC